MKYHMSRGINKVLVQVSNQALQNLETGQETVPSHYKSTLEQSNHWYQINSPFRNYPGWWVQPKF